MIVEVMGGTDQRPQVEVVDVDDLSSLHLALGEVTDEEADQVLREAGLGRLADADTDGDTGYLDAAALRAAAEPKAREAGWAQRWEQLLELARSEGWSTDDGAGLQVRVESAAGA